MSKKEVGNDTFSLTLTGNDYTANGAINKGNFKVQQSAAEAVSKKVA